MKIPTLEITNRCISCDNCNLICPEDAIITDGTTYKVDQWACIFCNLCIEACPVDCIKLEEGVEILL